MAMVSHSSLSKDQFRILNLHPGRESDPLNGTLKVVSFTNKPVYTAVSYVWGKDDDSQGLIIDGVSKPTKPSLQAALRGLRSPDAVIAVWADGICINQGDKAEKDVPLKCDWRPGELYTNLKQGNTEQAADLISWYLWSAQFVTQAQKSQAQFSQDPQAFAEFLLHGQHIGANTTFHPLDEFWEPTLLELLARAGVDTDSDWRSKTSLLRVRNHLAPFIRDADWLSNTLDATRILAVTSDSRAAWVPNGARVGDFVCLFQGAPFPFVIRRTYLHGISSFSVVGDAYVHGIMRGESWPEDEDHVGDISLL
ncbi:hypothetical protein D0867_03889 [Hortaea werneckii]|uniref:Heterokaryon incompatibility domain-containing protein n=1 Tax=Hortaea werneckii TaxID=91943 RepID=A0A3M6ZZU7_HORWE|nr:hypothetical protein D0867_03889 [Hortaea werneckii]